MKVVVRSLDSEAPAKLAVKRLRDREGRDRTVTKVDADSRTFGQDFRTAFARSVRKARRDNKKITGSHDLAVGES